mgnify:CR=1 FL=1
MNYQCNAMLFHSRDVLVHDGVVVTHNAQPGSLLGVAPVLQGLPHHRGANNQSEISIQVT